MFTFTLTISILAMAIAVGFGIWSYLAFRSDSGRGTDFIGSIVGIVFLLVAIGFGVAGSIGLVIILNRVYS